MFSDAPDDATWRSLGIGDQIAKSRFGIVRAHQRFANEKTAKSERLKATQCSASCSPLSLIMILSCGASAIRRSLVFNETSNVWRSRLFTPMIFAPALTARRNSSEVCTSTSASSPSSSSATLRSSPNESSSSAATMSSTASAPAMAQLRKFGLHRQ